MPKYKVSVDLLHTFHHSETYDCEIEASNQDEAMTLGEKAALKHCNADSFDADLSDTEITGGETNLIEGTDIEPPYRCDKTPDMFEVVCPK